MGSIFATVKFPSSPLSSAQRIVSITKSRPGKRRLRCGEPDSSLGGYLLTFYLHGDAIVLLHLFDREGIIFWF